MYHTVVEAIGFEDFRGIGIYIAGLVDGNLHINTVQRFQTGSVFELIPIEGKIIDMVFDTGRIGGKRPFGIFAGSSRYAGIANCPNRKFLIGFERRHGTYVLKEFIELGILGMGLEKLYDRAIQYCCCRIDTPAH